jgi:hypothetical protein
MLELGAHISGFAGGNVGVKLKQMYKMLSQDEKRIHKRMDQEEETEYKLVGSGQI